jgi:hypothetical protein
MATTLDLGVERDHIESLTKASGISAISELIWNSIDADSTEIQVNYETDALGGYKSISVEDNGHGLSYDKAKAVFSKLGGSEKKTITQSPKGRSYHGKEGKGRYKSLALGDLITFTSTYRDGDIHKTFTIKINRESLSNSEISDLRQLPKGQGSSGFTVHIQNVDDKNAEQAVNIDNRREIEERFASFWINYQDFKIFFNGNEMSFRSLIKNTYEETPTPHYVIEDVNYPFSIKIIEWNFDNKKKTYFCNTKGIPFSDINLGIRSSLPLSVFIESSYIEKLHRENTLNLGELNENLNVVYNDAKKIARKYLKDRLHQYSKEFIDELKRENIYPYNSQPENIVEESARQVFDIVALQVNEYLPSFGEQDKKGKKLTLSLIKEALESGSANLKRILSEVIELPKVKQDELADILEDTSLSCIIDAMTEIKNRLNFLQGLEKLIYDKDLNKQVKERKHLHKIIVRETWIFGDEYTYGVDDVSLKNVLKAYLKEHLQREDFEEIVEGGDNDDLQTIPDVCLWQQYSLGKRGKENLVVELKKPTVDAGIKEKGQIEGYAARVASDARFPKEKTRWKFYLITKEIKSELEPLINQKHRKYGHVSEGDNFDVYILRWGDIITDAKLRHEFIKDKLNLTLQDDSEGLEYLRTKYKEYLPDNFGTE